MFRELYEMCNLQYLPLKKEGVCAHYEGSIDKTGFNSDWDWELYKEDNKNEWVIFDCKGPGCIYNFVQHRYIKSSEVVFRFYFDGEKEPRFQIKPQEFGEKYPFLEPVASKYIARGNENGIITNEKAIRVVRSFVPMPFGKSCKITSSLPLMGNSIPEGGWGHVVYHTYSDGRITETFDPENPDYLKMISLWSQVGKKPIQPENESKACNSFEIKPGEEKVIFSDDEAGLITSIKLITEKYCEAHLRDLILSAKWDNHENDDFNANFGCIFSNEQGLNKTSYLLAGLDTDGEYYCYYPMPYVSNAQIVVKNNGTDTVKFNYAAVSYTRDYNELYKDGNFGYFSGGKYYTRKCTHGSDSIIAEIEGSGHVVGSIITGYGINDGANCEGDARIHFNKIRTPQIESDGSESYSCYGWGFEAPVQCNPSSGYDGRIGKEHGPEEWSMTRQLTGDWYPYRDGFRFGIESFDYNNKDMEHSGMVFYYNTGEKTEYEILHIVTGDANSETEAKYKRLDNAAAVTKKSYFEGDDDDIEVELTGYFGDGGCEFTVNMDADAKQIAIRRVSYQKESRQLAKVFVNDKEVTEYPWYFADRNPYKSWLEDEFIIPSHYIAGEDNLVIRIIPLECNGRKYFNEFGYKIFAIK